MMPAAIKIYTDGACIGNPGPGGFAGVIIVGESVHKVRGREKRTTNSRMEIRAVTESLSYLDSIPEADGAEITVYSDSRYVVDAFNQDWLSKWRRNGWRTSKKQRVKNQDLWRELHGMVHNKDISFRWVAGHDHDQTNDLCDRIARSEARKVRDDAAITSSDGDEPSHHITQRRLL